MCRWSIISYSLPDAGGRARRQEGAGRTTLIPKLTTKARTVCRDSSLKSPRSTKLFGKDPDAGRDWGQEEKGTEDEMAGWHH